MGRNKKNKSEELQSSQQNTEDIECNTQNYKHGTGRKREHCNESSDITDERIISPQEHDGKYSDTEDEPKKPKKRKKIPIVEESSTGKKNKISKRQMKKDKYAAKLALEQAQAKDQTKLQCLNYLSQWKHDKQNWKFMKARQVWLLKNKFLPQLIPETSWPLLLEYFESAKGNIKTILLNDANKIIKQMDEWTESQTNQDGECEKEHTEVVKPDEIVYNRARSLIQCLQE